MRNLLAGIRNAISGFSHTLKSEPNMRIHVAATLLVTAGGILFGIDRLEWALIALCVGMVVAMECMNTAVERLADRVTANDHPLIRNAKDAAAGAVLVACGAAAVVGLLIFLPRLI